MLPGHTFGSLPPPSNASGSVSVLGMRHMQDLTSVACCVKGEQGRMFEPDGAGQEGDNKSMSIQQSCPQTVPST